MMLDNVEDCREQTAYVGRDLSGTGARTLDDLHRAYMEISTSSQVAWETITAAIRRKSDG